MLVVGIHNFDWSNSKLLKLEAMGGQVPIIDSLSNGGTRFALGVKIHSFPLYLLLLSSIMLACDNKVIDSNEQD